MQTGLDQGISFSSKIVFIFTSFACKAEQTIQKTIGEVKKKLEKNKRLETGGQVQPRLMRPEARPVAEFWNPKLFIDI
jgi:hypothetical protein